MTPSDFNETRFTRVSQHAEYDGEISFSSHIILCPPEGKTGQIKSSIKASGGKTMICDAELTSPSYSACWKTLVSPFSSISEGVANVMLNTLPTADSHMKKSNQNVTPSDFNERRSTGVSQHAEYDGEISFSSHIIVCPPEGKTGQSQQEETSGGKTMICDGEIISPLYSACWEALMDRFSSNF